MVRQRFESPEHLAWIREQSCSRIDAHKPGEFPASSEPHHLKGYGKISGASMKAPDLLTMPLCTACHREFHYGSIPNEDQALWLIRTIDKAIRAGVIVTGEIPEW